MDTLSADPLFAALRDGGRCSPDQLRALEDVFSRLGSEHAALADALNTLGVLTRYQYRKVQLGRVSEILFGQYLILEKIGEGGMGKVYRGVDTRMARMVALKVIRPQLMSNKTVLKRYEREAAAAARLDHPNIVKLFDAGEAGGRFYLAMEYVDGSDLSRLVKDSGHLSTAEACEYMRMAALGLQHAHECGFVHRDIKPSNLLVYGERAIPGTGGKAQLKILDMGLIRNVADDDQPGQTELTRDGTVVGTPDYMSPEQAKNSSSVDSRADLYSLGCTLYYLLRGQVPFPEGSPIDKLIRHQLDPVPDVRLGRSDIPPMVGDIVARLLRKRPEERYQSAGEVAALLAHYTPDAAVMDLSPPSLGPGLAPTIYDAVDLSAPGPTRGSRAADTPRSTPSTPAPVSTRTPKNAVAVLPRVPAGKPKAIPKPISHDPISSESLPTPQEPRRVHRVRKSRTRKRGRNFPTLTAVVVVGFALLLLGLGAFALVRLNHGGPPAVTTPATEPKKAPPTAPEPPPKNNFVHIETLLPNNTEAVLLLHSKPYWDKIAGEWKPGSHQAKFVEYLSLRYHFDPRKLERATLAFQADPTKVVAAGEGAWLTPNWVAGLDKARRLKVDAADNRGTQTIHFFELAPTAREVPNTSGAIFKGQAYAITDDRPALENLVKRLKSKQDPLTEIDPLLLPPLREAAKGSPFLFFGAASGFRLPQKAGSRPDTLAQHGVDLATVSGRLEHDFTLDVVLVGRDDKQLKEFLAVALPKLLDSRGEKLKPLADAVRKASDNSQVELESVHGFRVSASVVWKWDEVLAALEALLPLPPLLDKN